MGESSIDGLGGRSVSAEAEMGSVLDNLPVGVLILDADTLSVLESNVAAQRAFDLAEKSGEVRLGDLLVGFSDRHAQALLRRLRQGLVDHLVVETRKRGRGGDPTPVEIRFSFAQGSSPRYLALVLDMSERSKPDEIAVRRERLRDALAEILRMITRIGDRDELYREACRIAVERGGFRLAWIGIADETTGEIVPVASAGDATGYVENLHLSIRDDPRGPGMTVTAVQTGEPVAIADPRTDPMFTTLKRQVQERGFQSAVALPLVVEGRSIGALTVYGGVVNAFGAIEVELLQHLADDISFKLEVIGREEARRAAEADRDRLAAVVEQAGESVIVTGPDGRIVYANPAFTKITGYGVEEALGRSSEFLSGETQPPEVRAAIDEAVREGKTWAGTTRGRRKDGPDSDLHVMISPRRDHRGAIVGSIIIGRDESRERSLEAQLIQSQKIEAVGRLAGGIAHDFNNLLTAISGYAEILSSELGPDDPRTEDVAEIQRAAGRATQLTKQLLAFSRRQILRPRLLDPQAVVTTIAPMLRRLIGEDVRLEVKAESGLGPIMADPSQLDQVLMNLALNARDSMPTGGWLGIEVEEVDLDDAFVAGHVGARPGRYVVLQVSDTGSGMTPEVLSHAFEPFFTTKGTGKGTGLGLSTVLGIVEQSNGYVDVASEPGRGTTFRIYLPQALGTAAKPRAGVAPRQEVRGAFTVLVVEDEEPVRALVSRILGKAGYKVLEAATGEQALEIEAAHDGVMDLLFTDVILPGMSGRQLAEQMKDRRPEMPVLYASGYNQEIVAARGVLEPGISYMTKPYSAGELLKRVGDLVGSGPVPATGEEGAVPDPRPVLHQPTRS